MNFEIYLIEQIKRHPSAMPQDVVKHCYQAAYGAEHLLSDIGRARSYLEKEYAEASAADGELYEWISDDVCRVNLSAWKAKDLPIEWLFRMFAASCRANQNADLLFEEYLCAAGGEAAKSVIPFAMREWEEYLNEYRKRGMPAVHHSEQYRRYEKPAYRIVSSRFIRAIPILLKAAAFSESKDVCTIAIDGRAASGKTSLAKDLQTILDADIIQMDDFFLPPGLRTEERLGEAGGNIHYERFMEEVIPYVSKRVGFSYRIFDCGRMDYNGAKDIGTKQFRIVEGSYSCHPKFGKYADITVFSDVPADEQLRRIRNRNGEDMLKVFRDQWIPMEEKYFDCCLTKSRADIQV